MARETKVGVLAGLAFIICFAIVLANRGRQHSVPTGAAFAERVPTSAPHPQDTTVQRVTYRPAGDVSYAPAVNSPAAYSTNPYAIGQDRNPSQVMYAPSSPATPVVSNRSWELPPAFDSTKLDARNAPVHGAHDLSTLSLASPSGGNAGLRPVPQMPGTSQVIEVHEPLRGNQTMVQNPPMIAADTRFAEKTANPSPTGTRHVVAPGETLTKIAAAKYGRKSSALVRAIYEANRGVIPNPDNVAVGTELLLPDLAGTQASAPVNVATVSKSLILAKDTPKDPKDALKSSVSKKADKENKESVAPPRNAEPEPRWYQVRKNDRLVSIAREQLGNANRWREIFELNRDKFPDPEKIREGVRIKLPGASGNATQERRS